MEVCEKAFAHRYALEGRRISLTFLLGTVNSVHTPWFVGARKTMPELNGQTWLTNSVKSSTAYRILTGGPEQSIKYLESYRIESVFIAALDIARVISRVRAGKRVSTMPHDLRYPVRAV